MPFFLICPLFRQTLQLPGRGQQNHDQRLWTLQDGGLRHHGHCVWNARYVHVCVGGTRDSPDVSRVPGVDRVVFTDLYFTNWGTKQINFLYESVRLS
jgi:hypothetical protein